MINLALSGSLLLLVLAPAASAQDVAKEKQAVSKDTVWKVLGEIGIGAADNDVVATGVRYMKEFIAAGVEDGNDDHFTNVSFLTPETFAALPLRYRFFLDPKADNRRPTPFLVFDHEKEIAFDKMFANMNPQPLEGAAAWHVRGVHMCKVKRPNGGFRLNFGNRDFFGQSPTENPLFTTYTEITAKPDNERLMTRLRQMPIHAMFDFRKILSQRENKELVGLFGPKGALVAGSITKMGNRPVVDLHSAIRAGEGLVGAYLAKKPGHARILGALNFEPHAIFAVDLGTQVPRMVLTLANGARQGADLKDVLEPLIDLLDVWTGELTVVAAGVAPPAEVGDAIDLDEIFARFAKSLEGTIIFGVEEDSSADVINSLETFLGSDAAKKSEFEFEAAGEKGRRTFLMAGKASKDIGVKFVSFGGGDRLVVVSIANTATKCLDRRDGTLAKQSSVRTPKKLGLAQGPVNIWVHNHTLRYVSAWCRAWPDFGFGSRTENIRKWILDTLENKLLSENFAASLSWTARTGTMLRLLF